MDFQEDIRIGHPGDALALLEQVLTEKTLDQDVIRVLEAVKDAIERGDSLALTI